MMIKVKDGDLAIGKQGVIHKPFALHGADRVTTWPWSDIRRIAIEDGGRKADRENLAFGLVGLLFKTGRSLVVISLTNDDIVFETKEPIAELRAMARRLQDDLPELAPKIVV